MTRESTRTADSDSTATKPTWLSPVLFVGGAGLAYLSIRPSNAPPLVSVLMLVMAAVLFLNGFVLLSNRLYDRLGLQAILAAFTMVVVLIALTQATGGWTPLGAIFLVVGAGGLAWFWAIWIRSLRNRNRPRRE